MSRRHLGGDSVPARDCRRCGARLDIPVGYCGRVRCRRCGRVFDYLSLRSAPSSPEVSPPAAEERGLPRWVLAAIAVVPIIIVIAGAWIRRDSHAAPGALRVSATTMASG